MKGNLRIRAKAIVRIAWPVAWSPEVERTERFRIFWDALGGVVSVSEWGRRLTTGIDFSFDSGATLHVFVPHDWDDERAIAECISIAESVYQRCGIRLEDERQRLVEWDLARHQPIAVQIDSDYCKRKAEAHQRENGTSAGAVEG